MKDFFKTIFLLIIVIGLWVAVPIFAAFVSTGLALIFLYQFIKHANDEIEEDP